jgi:hypothetical protein
MDSHGQILCWVAVGLRLYTRLHIVHEPGLDDLFIDFAAIVKLVGLVAFYGGKPNVSGHDSIIAWQPPGLDEGIGKHIIYNLNILEPTMIWFHVANAAYIMTTLFVKLSLLFQYLRLLREGYRRTITLILLTIVSLWGLAFTFMAWFPCFPVSGFWNTLFAFSGSNMILDIAIFLLPLTEYFKPDLRRKQVLAMTGLFALGSV